LTQLLIIRHGRTGWNRVERFRGRAELELDEFGVKQAGAAAKRVTDYPVKAVYCSPLKRALTTASIIAKHLNLEAKLLPGIIDIDFGEWQGLSPEEAAARDGALYATWLKNPQLVRFPGGESLSEVRQRAAIAVEELVKQYPDVMIALISHRVVCQILILHLLGLDNSHFWQIDQDVCAINVFEVNNGTAFVRLLNDTCHLKNSGLN
jgi:broad specificity phosphatase PhoE